VLVALLKDPSPYVQERAAIALRKLDPKAAAQAGVN
jgi:HEAT repeat protein